MISAGSRLERVLRSGRFAVTDTFRGELNEAAYGCCALALSATQPSLPSGWFGGNRIAIHGTPRTDSTGAVSIRWTLGRSATTHAGSLAARGRSGEGPCRARP